MLKLTQDQLVHTNPAGHDWSTQDLPRRSHNVMMPSIIKLCWASAMQIWSNCDHILETCSYVVFLFCVCWNARQDKQLFWAFGNFHLLSSKPTQLSFPAVFVIFEPVCSEIYHCKTTFTSASYYSRPCCGTWNDFKSLYSRVALKCDPPLPPSG